MYITSLKFSILLQVTILKTVSLNRTSLNVAIPVDSTIQEVLVSVVGKLATAKVTVVNPEGEAF